MEETKSKVKSKKSNVKEATKSEVKTEVQTSKSWEGKSVKELKLELQKLYLEVIAAKEQNTSLIRKLKKHIARELTRAKLKN